MADASWPTDLPTSFMVEGFEEQIQDTRLRTTFDTGVPQMRRRFTAALRYLTGSIIITQQQVDSLDTFVQTTLNGGVNAFNWVHPRTGEAKEMRFVEIPSYPSFSKDQNGTLYRVELKLEVLP